jgi:hydrogenase maturation protease
VKPLVLGLGNDLLGDDGIGILTARALMCELSPVADVVESSLHGIALIDILSGYRQVLIIDAIQTGTVPPGTVLDLRPSDLRSVIAPSPHYTGLPEMIRLARETGIDFPDDIRILAVEIVDASTLGAPLSPPVAGALPEVNRRVGECVRAWVAAGCDAQPAPDGVCQH